MKIAVACDKRAVTNHFGHCESFVLFEVENSNIMNEESIPNPGHKPGYLPNFLADLGIDTIISGGMGAGAVEIFQERGIETVLGAQGDVLDTCKRYMRGELKSSGSVCNHDHANHGNCGE